VGIEVAFLKPIAKRMYSKCDIAVVLHFCARRYQMTSDELRMKADVIRGIA
jgi:hypothetical protein